MTKITHAKYLELLNRKYTDLNNEILQLGILVPLVFLVFIQYIGEKQLFGLVLSGITIMIGTLYIVIKGNERYELYKTIQYLEINKDESETNSLVVKWEKKISDEIIDIAEKGKIL